MNMRLRFFGAMLAMGVLAVLTGSVLIAQPGGRGASESADQFVKKIMAFDKSKDGKLTKQELIDQRLHGLFDRADRKKQGFITRADLEALFARENLSGGGFKGGGPGGKGKGPGGFPGGKGGKKGPGGRGGFGPPPGPGQVLPDFLQDALELSPKQREQVEALQKEINQKLGKILNESQRKLLREMRQRGPGGGFGPPGGIGPRPFPGK